MCCAAGVHVEQGDSKTEKNPSQTLLNKPAYSELTFSVYMQNKVYF